ncbi:hypothetical protein [Deinococcus maricopensis]|nr:hypothetical protein [Deinococcus maricopensis]
MFSRVALIAGGTDDVGLAIARDLRADGLRVAVQGPPTLWAKNVAELNDFIFLALDDAFTEDTLSRALDELTWVYRTLDVLVTVSAPDAALPAALARRVADRLGERGEGRLVHVTLGGPPAWTPEPARRGLTVNAVHADLPSGQARPLSAGDVAALVRMLVQPAGWCVTGTTLHLAGR